MDETEEDVGLLIGRRVSGLLVASSHVGSDHVGFWVCCIATY